MARLIYSAIASLDGYVEDQRGRFDWAEPDAETFALVNEVERPIGTYLLGRRMYEMLLPWETAALDESVAGHLRDFTRMWLAAEKLVYSRTLASVSSAKTRLERNFEAREVARLKASAARDLTVGGANLAGQAIAAGLVDEFQLFVVPVVVGGGKSWLPTNVRLDLHLCDCRRLANGVAFLVYRPVR